MRVSLRWLNDYVLIPRDLRPADLAHRLTMAGIEVGAIESTDDWDHVYVGQINRIEKHPNADRLVLATVGLGDRQQTVVTGAPNLVEGQKVPFALVGARLFSPKTGQHEELKPAKLRGVVSEGMVCSEVELGLGEDHSGILILPPDAPVGQPLKQYLGDTILDCEPTPNRPDCLSMLGIGHEVAALIGAPLTEPDLTYPTGPIASADKIAIEIADPALCARYLGVYVENVRVGPSPDWLQKRLIAAGQRPINNIVDITNYVMLEYGQPLHAFDYDLIRGHKIIVRPARPGERLKTLDGVDRQLTEDTLVIADAEGAVAIAGVMGGENSEVSAGTTRVLLEAANFHNISIRRTSQRLKLRSEASSRFDKGISPELIDRAAARAVRLMIDLAGATAAHSWVDVYPRPRERRPVPIGRADIRRILGVDWDLDRVRATLESLGFACRPDPDVTEGLLATPPYYRMDVGLTEDLIEEVARITGYDEIPTEALTGRIPPARAADDRTLVDRVKDLLVAAGMQEVINYSLVSRDLLERIPGAADPEPIRVINPLSAEGEYLRTTLRASILQNAAANQRWSPESLRLFEVDKTFQPREDDLPDERRQVAGLIAGLRGRAGWHAQPEKVDFYDAKGIVEALLEAVAVPDVSFEPGGDDFFHPGKVARVLSGDLILGVVGEVHPLIADDFDLGVRPVCLFELELSTVVAAQRDETTYAPLPRFPAVVQDLALVVDRDVPAGAIQAALASADLVTSVDIFDVYEGDRLPPGRKSVAFRISYQSPDRTLTDADVQRVQDDLVRRVHDQFGATLRG